MALLVNPGHRYVEVDENVEYWLNEPGFRRATDAEEKEYRQKRLLEHARLTGDTSHKDSIYFVSVSQKGGADGYGMSSQHIIDNLQLSGINVSEYYVEQDIGLMYHSPVSITRLDTPYKILYTMFESDKIPHDWKDYLHAADKVLVPSKWCQKIFKEAGVETTVVPLGYNDQVFKPIERTDDGVWTFLHYDAFNVRKGHFEVLEAFSRAFKPTDKVRLIMKTTKEVVGIPINKGAYPNVETIYGKVPELELMDILKSADVFVFPSRGEGFGITPLEAMATGIPAIVPNAHGISEYFDDRYMYGVKADKKSTAIYKRLTDVGNMVECDINDLAKQMRYTYEHQIEAKKKGKLAQKYVQKYTYKKTAEQLKAILEDVKSKPMKDRKAGDILHLQEV